MTKLACVVMLVLLLCPASAGADEATIRMLAPADSYFGQVRMSVLGMRNAVRDIGARVDISPSEKLLMLYQKLTMVEDAVLDLKHQYPHDSWLPSFGLSLAEIYFKLPFDEARVRANDICDWVMADFPQSAQAADARRLSAAPMFDFEDIPLRSQ